jgi:hypothetical protein
MLTVGGDRLERHEIEVCFASLGLTWQITGNDLFCNHGKRMYLKTMSRF